MIERLLLHPSSISFFREIASMFHVFFQFLKIWPTLVGSCTLWKTSKRAIPLSPLVLPNNRFLLWKTISHSSKCLYTLTFVCSYLFQTIKREIYTWVSIKVSHNGAKINIKCPLKRKSLIQHCERSELSLHFEWTKVHWKCQKWGNLASFWTPEAYGQTVLPDMSILIGQELEENAKVKKFKWDILGNFQTLCGS